MSNKPRSGPLIKLSESVGKSVLLRIRGNREIKGVLKSFDNHLNLHLDHAVLLANKEQEIAEEELGQIIVRGDNVIFVSPV